MRLIRLKVRNIASLKGEHLIDFKEIQQHSPLFAITGETGSGKSSILNSIGLALYGQIYKKNVTQLDVVTLGEKDGSIELIFQVKGKFYLADWRARVRKQNGEPYATPQTPSRNLYTLDGDDFNSSKNIASVTTQELLNLDFDQFCKCIILNQGEFAKFLTSNFTERKDILEKLYPGELLENMGKELKLELDGLQATKNELDIKLSELKGDTTSGDFLKEEKAKLGDTLKVLEKRTEQIEKLDYHFISLFTYHEKFAENEKKKEQIKKDMAIETTRLNHIIKNGEEIHERYQQVKKEQEIKLPLLQSYLKKEETLKLLEEGFLNLQKKETILKQEIKHLEEKLLLAMNEEKKAFDKTAQYQATLTLPLKELKEARPHFAPLFDTFAEKELLIEELKGKSERLAHLEVSGKELKKQLEDIEEALKLIPTNIKDLELAAEKRKSELSTKLENRQRAQIKLDEQKNLIQQGQQEASRLEAKLAHIRNLIEKTEQDIFPLETTLKLQEVLNATEVCIDHALTQGVESCPVCEQNVPAPKWQSLKEKLGRTDLELIRQRFEEGTKVILKSQEEEKLYVNALHLEKSKIQSRQDELALLTSQSNEKLPSLIDIDQELSNLRKQSWERGGFEKESATKKTELQKTRDLYAKLKNEMTVLEKNICVKEEQLSSHAIQLKGLVAQVDRDTIRDLKNEVRNLTNFLDAESTLEKMAQEKNYLLAQKNKLTADRVRLDGEIQQEQCKINELKKEVEEALKGEKASDLIFKLNQLAKNTAEEWNHHVHEQKKQELVLKDSSGRLYQLDELTKDYDLHFTKELHNVREVAGQLESEGPLTRFKELELNFSSPRELFVPLKDLLGSQKELCKASVNECRMNFASISTRLAEWEKLQDKIQLLELQAREVNAALSRKMRLFEVLGKDELRTFVLALVEENLIYQTNEELQKLCQGRYEIVHQTRSMKMTPEFFILDKFREGGRRKVSTLSGGETFMVSLAMALALAEMTRGQAEIDSLFIDEGFGTLDQESLEDVLDMLGQIQTRGLMVGIISHIKTLTNALPVNLVLSKKQDGTSSIRLQFN